MNTTLPASRELPAQRHEQIRAALIRTVQSDPANTRRWRRPALVAAAAAAALALVIGLITGQFGFGGGPGLQRVEPGAQQLELGISQQQRQAIERTCSDLAEPRSGSPTGDYTLYNVIPDGPDQRLALLYSMEKQAGLSCQLSQQVARSGGSLHFTDIRWLPGPVSVETVMADDRPGHGRNMVAGRVSAEVAKLTYNAGGHTTRATLANGTFGIVSQQEPTEAIDLLNQGVLRAYDANDELIATIRPGRADFETCYRTPSGRYIWPTDTAPEGTPKQDCEPAVRWEWAR